MLRSFSAGNWVDSPMKIRKALKSFDIEPNDSVFECRSSKIFRPFCMPTFDKMVSFSFDPVEFCIFLTSEA